RTSTAVAEAERKRQLADEGITAKRSAQLADTERRALEIELDAARQRVRALGGSTRRSKLGSFELRAPIAGEVVHVGVERGQPVDPNYNAFRVADLSDVWVELAVFERELASVETGDEVTLAPRSRPDASIRGKVDHVGAVLNPRTRSATVRVVVPNEGRELAIGESVLADIATRVDAVRAPAVPRDAVVLVDGHPTVFVAIAPGTVDSRRVTVAAEGVHWIAIREGVREGESVVVEGVFALKSELFR
ncbi:MAG: efflux RND transporter periplasmic adaptor subunit, partial [Deltaproteobacteria bacterium]|nr:efflux RND transporter periplasmic adaptor subunit [Nannocystaceae bacterium]